MVFYAPSLELAHRAAAHLNATDRYKDPSRPTTKYLVDRYPTPHGRFRGKDFTFEWGVVRRWAYADSPELGEFGGTFMNLQGSDWA